MSILLDAEGEKPVIYPVWFIWLDVEDDPLYSFTGVGEISFGATETGDAALDGKTFTGLGQVAMIGDIQESENGSGPVRITVPGVDPAQFGFKELVAQRKRWQWRRAVMWFSYITEDGTALVDAPQREKTGRMDNLEIVHDGDTCTITLDIAGFSSSGKYPNGGKYAEQSQIDPLDIGMSFVADLANRQPEIGPGSSQTTNKPGGGGGGSRKPGGPKTYHH